MKNTEPGTVAAPHIWASGGRSWATLGACGAAHVIHDGLVAVVYVLLPVWAQSFSLSLVQAAALKTAYGAALALFQVPAGFLSERLGERGLLVAGTALAGIGYLLLGWAGSFAGLLAVLLLAGIGASVQHPLASSLVSGAFESGPRRAAMSTYYFSGDLGKMALPALAALSLGAFPWQHTTTGVGLLALAAAVGLLLSLRSAPAAPREEAAPEATPAAGLTGGWGITDRAGFTVLSLIGIIEAGTRGGLLVLLPFLLIDKGASVEMVGLALTLLFAGGACGKFVCGLAAGRIGVVRTVLVTQSLTAGGILLVVSAPLELEYLLLLPFGIALNGTASVLVGTVADMIAPERRARAFALYYTLITGSAAVAPLIYGAVGDLAGIPTACAIMAAVVLLTLPLCFRLRE